MAHAARLNLRMQKELKLLLIDPPPGASFPFLSADSDLTSLSTIHAQIEGPEGTVYAKGIFDIKIQIPERYPFQPPSVTFATPIYHPNIDSGGRICLDILNLPPKGAWQPSLNISTVLTSIGLLLSEPNPDDGLMCEASREYKYNRQAFDQKARSMTEKFAEGGTGRNNRSTQGVQTNLNPSMIESRGSEDPRLESSEFFSSHDKQCGISQKLSLESSSSSQSRDTDKEVNEDEAKGKRKDVNITIDEWNLRREKACGIRRKLSLESSCQIQRRDGHDKETVVPNETSLCSPLTICATSSVSSELHRSSNLGQQRLEHQKDGELMSGRINMRQKQPNQFNQIKPFSSLGTFQVSDDIKKMLTEPEVLSFHSNPNASCGAPSMPLSTKGCDLEPSKESVKFKKILSFGKKLSLGFKGPSQGQENDNKENVAPTHKLPLSGAETSSNTSGFGRNLSLGPLTQLQGSNDNNSRLLSQYDSISTDSSTPVPTRKHHGRNNEDQSNQNHVPRVAGETEQQKTVGSPTFGAVIVLDSEDSEEENYGILRSNSKLRLARKRLGNRRVKA